VVALGAGCGALGAGVARVVSGSLSTAELARSSSSCEDVVRRVLEDEVRRGHVERVGCDSWRATAKLVDRFDVVRHAAP
jgi:hypothetical protein